MLRRGKLFIYIIALLWVSGLYAQLPSDKYFDSRKPMPVGAYYYPEHWPRHQWERDIKRMADLGFTFTHYAEFAWADLEPQEGKYNFGWLDTAVALAQKYGLKVIMCTPSPCPPAWLCQKHPEILAANDKLVANIHGGSRLIGSKSSKVFRQYVAKIVEAMAKHYGNNPTIWGWQLDNEPHTQPLFDYSPVAQDGFRAWVKNKYKSLDSLNKHWGNDFWAQTYTDWNYIQIPNASQMVAPSNVNPHALLDFWRFQSTMEADFLKEQYDILKANIVPAQYVTTNAAYYKFLPMVDLFKFDYLDFVAHTMYLLSTYLGDEGGHLAPRLGSGLQLSFSNEIARSIKGNSGIMELQPGQINWGAYNPQPLPGAVNMWLWHNFGMGSKFVCTYRFRQPIFGSEQYHKGIMETDGVTVAEGGKEYVNFIKQLSEFNSQFDPNAKYPTELEKRKVAFYYDLDNNADLHAYPQNTDFEPYQHYYKYYGAAKRLGSKVTAFNYGKVVDAKQYPIWLVPSAPIVDDKQIAIWEKYVKSGGHLVFGIRSGMKNLSGHLHPLAWQEKLAKLTGTYVRFFDSQPNGSAGSNVVFASANNTTKTYNFKLWGEYLATQKNVEVWAKHDTANLITKAAQNATAAVTHHKIGKGSVTQIGVASNDGELEFEVIKRIFDTYNIPHFNQPPYFFTEWRDGVYISVNYTSATHNAPMGDGAKIIFGQKEVKPGGVCVFKY